MKSYIDRLYEERNVDWLKNEFIAIERTIKRLTDALIQASSEERKDIEKNLDWEREKLEQVKDYLRKLKVQASFELYETLWD